MRRLPRELLGQPFVVAVLEGDPGAAGLGDPEVARAAAPQVPRRGDEAEPRVGERRDRRDGAVVEPSSTTTSSKSAKVWRRTLAMAAPIVAARL